MKNLKNYANEVIKDFDRLGITTGRVVSWTVNNRANSFWGRCSCMGGRKYAIQISYRLMADDVDDMALKNTIAHELIHTIKGCMNHGSEFKRFASMLNVIGYNVKRATSSDEKGLEARTITRRSRPWSIQCSRCLHTFTYSRKTNAIKHMLAGGRCTCPCGASLTKRDLKYIL